MSSRRSDALQPVIEQHAAHLVRLNRRPGTIYQRRRTLARLEEFIAPTQVLGADIGQLRQYVTRGLGAEAAAGEVSRIRQFYRWALTEGLIMRDPSVRLERPSRPKGVPRPMPHPDVERAISEAPEPYRSWFLLASRAGLRACEIAPVRTRDIGAGLLRIPVQKGGNTGLVPISPGLAVAIAPNLKTPGWWFPHGTDPDRHVTPAQVSKRANRWLHDAGIPHTLHSLRHRFGTDVYRMSGHDVLLTAELLRHSNLNTVRTYAKLDPDRAASVLAMLDDAA